MVARYVLPILGLFTAFSSAALPTISTKGTKFFDSNNNQFFFKGVAYQLVPEDPLIDTAQCTRDAALMKQLGANSIRVYHVNPWANHDGCMAAFDAAGVYALIDLDTFNTTVTQTTPMWTQAQFQDYARVMDTFSKYSNVAGFYIGNEIINSAGAPTLAAPYIKASTADLKAYQKKMGYRRIPIGYSHADVLDLRPGLQDYLICGDSSAALDFFSLNAYEWCGVSNYQTSGYAALQNATAYYPAPIFISETGCNQPAGRDFQDQNAIFGPMSTTWSGSIVYEWIQEENQYGLITYGGGNTNALNSAVPAGGFVRSGTPTPVTPDFSNLEAVWKTVMPQYSTSAGAYQPNVTPISCPASTAGGWQVDPNAAIPTLGAAAVTAMSGYVAPAATSSRGSSTTGSARSSLSSAGASAASSASSLRSSLQSSATSAASSRASGAAATSSGAAIAGKQISGASTGLGGLVLGLLMWL